MNMIPQLIQKLLSGSAVDPSELEVALVKVMAGDFEHAQIAGLLVALASMPLDSTTLAAAARAMRSHRVAIHPTVRPLVDTCGTGGDGAKTFNISTAAAMVVAACGAAVAKHGNRGVSSPVGSADVIEAAGARLDLSPVRAREVLDATGFVFLFAPSFHPAMAKVAPVRRSLGVRTIFNVLGPLANPALAECQLIGVYDSALTRVVAGALLELGSRSALVVHCDGLDEIGLHGKTEGHRVTEGRIEAFELDPRELGVASAPISALHGGDATQNAVILREVLSGEEGPKSDVVAINAAAALELVGLVSSLAEGLELARSKMVSGAALRVLDRFCETSVRMTGVAS